MCGLRAFRRTHAERKTQQAADRLVGVIAYAERRVCLFVYVCVYVLYCTILSYMCVSPLILRSKVGALSTELKTDGQSVFYERKKKKRKRTNII